MIHRTQPNRTPRWPLGDRGVFVEYSREAASFNRVGNAARVDGVYGLERVSRIDPRGVARAVKRLGPVTTMLLTPRLPHSFGSTGGTGFGVGFVATFCCSLANLGAGLALASLFLGAGGAGGIKRSISLIPKPSRSSLAAMTAQGVPGASLMTR